MSIDFFVGEVQTQTNGVKSNCQRYISGLEAVKSAVQTFVDDTQLTGDTYRSAKSYFAQSYIPLSNGLIMLCEALGQAHEEFVSRYLSEVDSNDLQSELLEEQIRQLDTMIYGMMHELKACSNEDFEAKAGIQKYLASQRELKQELQERLNKLRTFDGTSAAIFSTIDSLASIVQQGLAEVASGKAWSASTGTFSANRLSMDWSKSLQENWENKENEKAKELFENFQKLPIENQQELAQLLVNASEEEKENILLQWLEENGMNIFSINVSANLGILENFLTQYGDDIANLIFNTGTQHFAGSGISSVFYAGAQAVGAAAPAMPIIGAVIDYNAQVATGTDPHDALALTGAHLISSVVIGLGAAALGLSGGWAIAAVVGVGFIANLVIDDIYNSMKKDIGNGLEYVGNIWGTIWG